MNKHLLPAIIGPTASGKTSLAIALATKIGGAVLSADSRQVYRQMDIGTGKDLDEYKQGDKTIPHYLIDIVDAGSDYNVRQYESDFCQAYDEAREKQLIPIICGGSGLYIQAALEGMPMAGIPVNGDLRDELRLKSRSELAVLYNDLPADLRSKTDDSTVKRTIRAIEIGAYLANNPMPTLERPQFEPKIFGLNPERKIRRSRISSRLAHRINNGLVEEVEALLASGISAQKLRFYGLEYLWVTDYVTGKIDMETMHVRLETAIHQFAKRQMTWFRSMEKKGSKINWLDGALSAEEQLNNVLAELNF